MRYKFGFILLLSIINSFVQAQELGEWQTARFQLQSGLGGTHVKQLNTNLFDSYLQLNWQLAPFYDLRLEWGDRQFLKAPVWSQAHIQENSEAWGLRQAYLYFQNNNLGFKFGYLPTAFGVNSLVSTSSEVYLPQLAWTHHLWELAAQSVQLAFQYEEWQTQLQVLPAKTGYTVLGHFSYHPYHAIGLDVGVWTTRQEASYFNNQNYWTDLGWSSSAQAWSHVRLTHLTLSRSYHDFYWIAERGQGDFLAADRQEQINWSLLDLRYYVWPKVGFLFRADQFLQAKHTDIGLSVRPTKFGAHWLMLLRQNQNQELSLWWWIKIRNF